MITGYTTKNTLYLITLASGKTKKQTKKCKEVELDEDRNTFFSLRRENRHLCFFACVFTQTQTKPFSDKRQNFDHFKLYWSKLCEAEHMTNFNKGYELEKYGEGSFTVA